MKNATLKSGGFMRLARIDEMTKQSGTIVLAEYSDYIDAVGGTSLSGGAAIKTHRPTNAVKVGASGVFNGEATATGYTGNDIRALEAADVIGNATTGFDSVNPNKGGTSNSDDHAHHLVYATEGRHNGSGNYAFVDGHGANHKIADTLDPTNYLWGTHAWTQVNKQAIKTSDGSGTVQ